MLSDLVQLPPDLRLLYAEDGKTFVHPNGNKSLTDNLNEVRELNGYPPIVKVDPSLLAPKPVLDEWEEHKARMVKLEAFQQENQVVLSSGKVKWKTDITVKPAKPEYGTEAYYQLEIQKAEQAIVRKELQTVARNQLYADPNRMLPDFACLKPLRLHIEQINGINTASQFVFITVSPDSRNNSQDIQVLMALAEKAVHKVWVGEWLFTLEQRGTADTPEYGTGIHIHFLFKKSSTHMKKAPTDMSREIRNTFKHVIGDGCFSAVDYKYSIEPLNFMRYLAGCKDEAHDPEVILADIQWRHENGLPSFYASSGWGQYVEQLEPEWAAFYTEPQ